MKLSSTELKTVKRLTTNTLFLLAVVLASIWGYRYYHFKQKTSGTQIGKNGQSPSEGERILPIDREAHRIAAQHLNASGQSEKALQHLQRLLALSPDDRRVRYAFARTCLDVEEYDKSFREIKILESDGINDSLTPKIAALKGIVLYYQNDLQESTKQLYQCLTRYPASAEAACFLGQIEAATPDLAQEALGHLEQAVKIDPGYAEGWYQLARFTMQKGDYAKARQQLGEALAIDPLHEKSHSRLGMIFYALGNFDLAKKSYLTALALNPKDCNTRCSLGELFTTAFADTETAMREFASVLKLEPGHAETNFNIGLICLRNNMVKEAIRYFQSAKPQEPRIMLQLAVAYEKIGDQVQALKTYREIVEKDPVNAIALQKIKFLTQR
jgi:tetratricopeptide (TPR) repeat protein